MRMNRTVISNIVNIYFLTITLYTMTLMNIIYILPF